MAAARQVEDSDARRIENQLPDARAFNPHLVARSDNLKALIEEVREQMLGYEAYYNRRQRMRKPQDDALHRRTIEALICDLCLLRLTPTNDALHLPLGSKVLNRKSRYKGVVMSKVLRDVLEVMSAEGMDFVCLEKGKTQFTTIDSDLRQKPSGGYETLVWPGPKLLSRIERFGIGRADIGSAPDEEVIVLRDRKLPGQQQGSALEYEDTAETNRLRAEMGDINAWLATSELACDAAGVKLYDRRLRRIFNNADFGQGGRLYGGFWQEMGSEARAEHIRIGGDGCVELDYGQMSLMLFYAEAGQIPPEGDLYDLTAQGVPVECRAGIKKVVQAIINSETLPKRFPQDTKRHFPARIKLAAVLRAIEARHPAVFPLMSSRVGMRMFRKEADILVAVLLQLKAKGIVALPIHDAVLVADEHKDKAAEVMKAVFKGHTGLTPKVCES